MLNRRLDRLAVFHDLSGCDTIVPVRSVRPSCPTRTFLRDARLVARKAHRSVSTAGGDIDKPVAMIAAELAKENASAGSTGRVTGSIEEKEATSEELRRADRVFARKVKGTIS